MLKADEEEDRQRAADLLKSGEIIALPTETVYGLGARGDAPDVLDMLYRVKNRPRDKKFTLMVPTPDDLERFADPSDTARRLAEEFWPGPLTLVVPDGEGGHVGLRCPDDERTRDILAAADVPVSAPGAGVNGAPPACSAEEVMAAFKGRIAAIVDGGPTRIGTASTVIRVDEDGLEVLRPGPIDADTLQAVLDG
jgi:L-threonylcarbamoyladenylate synthase